MKVDGGVGWELDKVGAQARELEDMGYSGILTAETAHDPFFPLLVAAQNTSKVDLMTSIAVAFARTPMILANIGHDLNAASKGRFILGLGSQIKPHITKRFSMPWSDPAARMREFILAMRAIWASWHEGKPLEFSGKYYTHTLMTPFFTPTDNEYGAPRVFLAAVGPLERGFAKAGKKREDFEISYPVFVVTGSNEQELAAARTATRKQIAFYGSTPAYKPVLDSIGAGELQAELNKMSKQGRWDAMGELITDDILRAFAVDGEPASIPGQIKARYGDVIDRTAAAYANIPKADRQKIINELSAA
jgi:alkanesulfonate monooxygenase SsuD/methylene tetrahydromethanopterin reductase-like flavin-dependent oxidoreductase (luciferase family)